MGPIHQMSYLTIELVIHLACEKRSTLQMLPYLHWEEIC
jgi:hypothetical protein